MEDATGPVLAGTANGYRAHDAHRIDTGVSVGRYATHATEIADAWVAVVWDLDLAYSGWNTAMVFPSGSLNQADRPMPGVVTT
jgi:hypothetical protein